MNVWNIIRTDLIFCGFPLYYIYYFKSEKQGIYTHTSCYSLFFFFFFNSFFRRRIIRFLILVYEEKQQQWGGGDGWMYALAGCCYNTAKRESHRYTYSRAAPIFLHSQVSISMCAGYTFGKGGGFQWRGEGSNSPTSIIPYSLRSLSLCAHFKMKGNFYSVDFVFFPAFTCQPPLFALNHKDLYICAGGKPWQRL